MQAKVVANNFRTVFRSMELICNFAAIIISLISNMTRPVLNFASPINTTFDFGYKHITLYKVTPATKFNTCYQVVHDYATYMISIQK